MPEGIITGLDIGVTHHLLVLINRYVVKVIQVREFISLKILDLVAFLSCFIALRAPI